MATVLAPHHSNVSSDIKTLSPAEMRYQICMFLSQRLTNGKLRRFALEETAETFGKKKESVRNLWRKHKNAIANPHKFKLDVERKKGQGRKRKIKPSDVRERVKAVPFRLRQTYRSLSAQVGIPRSTLHTLLQAGVLKKSRSAVKPMLTDANKVKRIAYCESFVESDGCFGDMLDRVDIDEKWWYITRVNTSYIMVDGETPPDRKVKHKSHIIKVMCLTAMARPRQNPVTKEWWDGKIGTWFFVEKIAAKRSSKHRPAGTLESKPVKVNKLVFTQKCLDDLLPAIIEKWPTWSPKRIRIQQDNATPHPKPGTSEPLNIRLEEMRNLGWDVAFVCQPPNSPDLNTEDLAFFRGIQSLQFQKNAYTIDQLMVNVLEAFHEFPLETCKKVWTTAQMVMNEILLCGGNNNYKLPHAGKDKIVRLMKHDIPLRLPCQAMINNGSLNGNAIIAYAKTLPPINNSSVVVALNNSGVVVESTALSALALLAEAVSDNAVTMEEDEGIVGTADDDVGAEDEDTDAATPSQVEFWENFETKIAWGGEDYENHEEGVIGHADLLAELEVPTVEEPTGSADLEDQLEVPTEEETTEGVVLENDENDGRWSFEARGESRESC